MEVCIDTTGNLNVNGGTGPYTWQQQIVTQNCTACLVGCNFPPGCAVNTTTWQNFASGNSITPPATYPIQVTDNNGQTLVVTGIATLASCPVNCPLTINVTNNTAASCGNNNGSITLNGTGGTAPYTYSWNNGQTGATASGLAAGNYSCVVTDVNGCQNSVSATVIATAALLANVSVIDVFCYGDKSGTAIASATNGTAPYSYSWAGGQLIDSIGNLGAGTYTCYIQDAAGCTATVTATIVQPPIMNLSTASTPNTGSGNGTATVTPSGGTPPYTYTWQTTPPQYTQTITGLVAGTYSCTVVDALGCFRPVTVTVTESTDIAETMSGIQNLTISPNPSNGEFTVKIEFINPEDFQINLYDISGKSLLSDKQNTQIRYQQTFQMTNLSKGIYLLKVQTTQGEITRKLLIE